MGLALVQAWRERQAGDRSGLDRFVRELLSAQHSVEVLAFINGSDVASLDPTDRSSNYALSLIAANIRGGGGAATNNHPEEVRYNVFQALQYLADWLAGNGCVALPAKVAGVSVRVMDDLATAERSRWQVWLEVHHGRFALADLLRIVMEEMLFIRKDLSGAAKSVAVKWNERTAKWYPVAMRVLLKLVTDAVPVEFATELLLPFTVAPLRTAPDPWRAALSVDVSKFGLRGEVERFVHFFEACGCQAWATAMSARRVADLSLGERLMLRFDLAAVNEAAAFHGDIGEARATLDAVASREQAGVLQDSEATRQLLLRLGKEYRDKFGMKFLISAQELSAPAILEHLQKRLVNSAEQELANARQQLWLITRKRLAAVPLAGDLGESLMGLLRRHGVRGAQVAMADLSGGVEAECVSLGEAAPGVPVTNDTYFEIASLSKPLVSAFAIGFFLDRGIPLSASVDDVLAASGSSFRLNDKRVSLAHLMRHEALNMHYVNGVPCGARLPSSGDLLKGDAALGYEPVRVVAPPGEQFHYSGAGFLVLELLLETLSGQSIQTLINGFLQSISGGGGLTLSQQSLPGVAYAHGFRDIGDVVEGTRKMFPASAAGGMGTATGEQHRLSIVAVPSQCRHASGVGHDRAFVCRC